MKAETAKKKLRVQKYPDTCGFIRPDSYRILKNFRSGERIRMPDAPDTCG